MVAGLRALNSAALLTLRHVPSVANWKLVLKTLSPGAHLAAICVKGSYHRIAVNVEDAGFEIRDQLMWLHGNEMTPIVLGRKPLTESTVAANVLKFGTGGINVDGCRIGTTEVWKRPIPLNPAPKFDRTHAQDRWTYEEMARGANESGSVLGRFPANVILDNAAGAMLDAQSGNSKSITSHSLNRVMTSKGYQGGALGQRKAVDIELSQYVKPGYSDSGSASRFFKCCDSLDELKEYLTTMILPPGGMLVKN